MIIWLASYPKSGNTWIRTILHQIIIRKNSQNGNWLSKIGRLTNSYPKIEHFHNLNYSLVNLEDLQNKNEIVKNWQNSQKRLNFDKKLKFLKTHNMLCSIEIGNNNFQFTNEDNTLGVIHVVRDPRNIITSLKNHFSFETHKEAFNFMTSENRWVGTEKNYIPEFLSSWEHNFESWAIFPKNYILFKYEDILYNPKKQIKRLIEYLQKFIKIDYNEEMINQIIKDTSFENLKDLEKKGFFLESVTNKKTNKKKKFFYLGPKNDFRELLNKKIKDEIEKKFQSTMKKLNYL